MCLVHGLAKECKNKKKSHLSQSQAHRAHRTHVLKSNKQSSHRKTWQHHMARTGHTRSHPHPQLGQPSAFTLPTNVRTVKAMVFPVVMYGWKSWTIKKGEGGRIDAFNLWCWRRLLRVPRTARRSKQSILEGSQPWIFIGRTNAEGEAPIAWPPDAKSWLIWKDPDAGKYWGQEKGTTKDEIVGWHHGLNGHEFG